MSRLAKSFVLFLLFAGLLLGATNANAALCNSSAAGGNWTLAASWAAPCNVVGGPTALDDVTILNGATVTVNAAGLAAKSVTIAGGNLVSTLTFSAATSSLAVTNNVVIGAPTAAVNKQITVLTGTLTVGTTVTATAGTTNGSFSQLTATSGSITIGGDVTLTGGTTATRDALLSASTGTITINGGLIINSTVAASSTASLTGAGTITVNGAAGVTNGGNVVVGTGTFNVTNAAATFTNSNAAIVASTTVSSGLLNVTGVLTNAAAETITISLAGGRLTVGGTLTNNGTITLSSTGTVTASGTLANGTTGTVTTGTGTVNAATFTNNNVVTVSTGLINVTGAYTNTAVGDTVTITGAGGRLTVGGTLTNAGSIIFNTAAGGIVNANGNFTSSGIVANTTAGILNIGGNATVNGTFTAGAGSVVFNGGSAQNASGATLTFFNVTMGNTGGVTLANNLTVGGTLTLTSGKITTGANNVIIGTAGTIATPTASSYVVGNFQKNYAASANLNYFAGDNFPVGDATNFTPVNISAGTITVAAGSLTVSTFTPDHPQVTTPIASTGIDAAKSVNRYWRFANSGLTIATAITAKFTFVVTDRDNVVDTPSYIIERYDGTNWNPTTAGAANALDTTASNITPLAVGNNDFAIGVPFFGVTAVPGLYNAFETATPAGAILGKIQTKVAGSGFSVDIVHINATKTGVLAGAITVEVRLLDSSGGGALDANGCNAAWPLIQALPNFAIPASGRGTIPAATVANSYRSVRFQIRSPVGGPYTQIGCSTDRFAIRPASLTVTAYDATWATAGIGRTLANTGASGGNVHKAATSASPLPFTLRATPLPATATNYDGTPTTVAGFPTCGTLCTTIGGLSFTAGSWTAAGSGVRENATANYSEAGTFNLQLEDATYASVDAVDGSTAAMRTVPVTASVEIGRFVPDHFDVTALITPTFKTFNATDAACSTGAAPRRTFTYIGQLFGYLTTPQATIFARNAAGSTTVNYSGTSWKISGTSSSSKDCTTDPNICLFTTSWTGGGNSSSVTESYAYTLVPVSTPGWDNAGAATAAATVTPGAGTGSIVISSSNTLAFLRNITTPQAAFTANIADTISVTDASENAVANNGIISTATPLVFNGSGSGIDFDGGGASNGKEFRYGRLKLANAHGSELLNLPVQIQAQYWVNTAFVPNVDDNCTTLTTSNIKLTVPPAGVSATVGGAFTSGVGSLTLTKPTTPAKVAVDLCVDLGADPVGGTVCSATSANLPYLQGLWPPGASYNNDPGVRATFGVYKGGNEFIYLRENY